jgi:hypothetical protein
MLNAECRMPNNHRSIFSIQHSAFSIRHSAFGIRHSALTPTAKAQQFSVSG